MIVPIIRGVKTMIVVYSNGDRVIVFSKADEEVQVKEWFTDTGHDVSEYERVEVPAGKSYSASYMIAGHIY